MYIHRVSTSVSRENPYLRVLHEDYGCDRVKPIIHREFFSHHPRFFGRPRFCFTFTTFPGFKGLFSLIKSLEAFFVPLARKKRSIALSFNATEDFFLFWSPDFAFGLFFTFEFDFWTRRKS